MDQYYYNQHNQHSMDDPIDSVSRTTAQQALTPDYFDMDQDLHHDLEPAEDLEQGGGVPLAASPLTQQYNAQNVAPHDTVPWGGDNIVDPIFDVPQYDHLELGLALRMPSSTPVPRTNSALPATRGQTPQSKLPLLAATQPYHLQPYGQPSPSTVDPHARVAAFIARTENIITMMEEVNYTVGRYQWLKNAVSRMKVLQNVSYLNAQSIQEIEQLEKFFISEAEMRHIADIDQMLRNKIKNLLKVRNAAMGEHAKSPESKELKVKLLEEVAEVIFEE